MDVIYDKRRMGEDPKETRGTILISSGWEMGQSQAHWNGRNILSLRCNIALAAFIVPGSGTVGIDGKGLFPL